MMSLEQLKEKTPIKRRDVGMAGAVIILTQVFSSFQSSNNVVVELAKFKEEFQASKVDREQFFVRKTDLAPLASKLDKLNDSLVRLNAKISDLKEQDDIVSCSLKQALRSSRDLKI